ncbi:HoxN/HupN/NixA family nickel/cobalt transporter [Leptolyngbya ectocarpi]|uniref:HoxN/HupN/NixA family nickel/cobalt transporter n=1 Tax=Leptolyngbya ectocarpi TaxID=1202 RepID=UPI001D15C0AC|nr:DUF3299 domain-containing protein [Leptolyngbya ectocarpi]
MQPPATTLQNPYAHLSIDQTRDLATLAGLKTWVEDNQPSPDSLESREVLRLNQKLQAQDLDVEELLSQIDQAQAYWQEKSQSINSQWIGKTVELSGYILPLTWNQSEQVTDFLLVPYVGACIHVPPPPPNQIVYIRPEQALAEPGLFTPVVVEGQLRSQPATYEVFQVDGSRPVDVSYALTLNHLTLSETPPVSIGQQPLPSGSWWQRLQARASAMLTQAVGNVHRQRSPGTFLWGLLISFSYGVLHTLGPGHGKAVIMSYFVGQGGSLRRGLTMGIQIAVFHVLSAIGVVVLTTLVLRQSTPDNYRLVQLVSYGAIAIIGGWMFWQAIPWRHKAKPVGLGAKAADLVLYPDLTKQVEASSGNALAVDCGCLTCVEPKRVSDWLALAIGSVPCSGALLILLYGSANNLLVPSIAMVIAISVGMAMTLAWIGTLALMGRNYAERRIHLSKRHYRRLHQWLRFAGSGCVLLLGLCLFGVTLASSG